MKKLIVLSLLLAPLTMFASIVETDTTIIVDNKRIDITDSGNRTKVKVYHLNDDGDFINSEMVFEGHYLDGQKYERRAYVGKMNIPLPTWNRKFNPHWCGFGMGFANFADGSFHINDISGVSLRSGTSLEYNVNFLEKAFPISHRYPWAVVTGMGIRWNRYRVNNDVYFQERNGVTSLYSQEDGYALKRSKLNTTSLTIPLLLEWQQPKRKGDQLFFSAGVVGVIKTASSSRIVYHDAQGNKHKQKMDGGMNIRPVTMDFLVQGGFNSIGVYAKYSPVQMFEKNKGPKVHPVSIGLHWYIW